MEEEQGDEFPLALKTSGLTAGLFFQSYAFPPGHWSKEITTFQTIRVLCTAQGQWACIMAQARYHRETNYCPSADLGSPPTEVLLPCNIYKTALFSSNQKGFGEHPLPHTCCWPRASWTVIAARLTGSSGQVPQGLTSEQKKSESLSGSVAARLPPWWRSLSHHEVS